MKSIFTDTKNSSSDNKLNMARLIPSSEPFPRNFTTSSLAFLVFQQAASQLPTRSKNQFHGMETDENFEVVVRM
jgi:hypothetical protein